LKVAVLKVLFSKRGVWLRSAPGKNSSENPGPTMISVEFGNV
jgi:hypothetical protein